MPRYVILTHDHPFPHWDLMLESGGVLRTWRLLNEPATGRRVPAERLADHRLKYLDYEGPVSGGRGIVARWDYGTYAQLPPTFQGRYSLAGTRDLLFAELASGIEGDSWLFGGTEKREANLPDATSSESAEPPRAS
ncbi:MAG: DNA polymerase ligase N-terminal domain-containing protein [Planctomycetaceae bacterium]